MNYGDFLHEKLNYNTKHVTSHTDIDKMINDYVNTDTKYACYDTETTGLNVMKDVPFLDVFGFGKSVYICDSSDKNLFNRFIVTKYNLVEGKNIILFAHNAKFDRHMMINNGTPIPDTVRLGDTMTLARLISPCDDEHFSVALESIGERYVDKSAKFASDLIGDEIKSLNKQRKKMVKSNYELLTGKDDFAEQWINYTKRIRFITKYSEILDDYVPATYLDIYNQNPELMIKYAIDDVVIMLEFIKKVMPIYANKYAKNGAVNNEIFFRENKLVHYIGDVERNGFKIDVDYLINSHYVILKYKQELYKELRKLTGESWTVGQHEKIKDFFNTKYNLNLKTIDKKAVTNLTASDNVEVKAIALVIKKLRTVDKWLSTYINRILNKIIEVNGEWRLYTTIMSNGAVSGRVSSDLQQMPKFPIYDENKLDIIDKELKDKMYKEDSDEHVSKLKDAEYFNPRRMVLPSKDTSLFFLDFSQVELRVQAFYTILIGKPDYNLCRAYMPYGCYNSMTYEPYDFTNPNHIESWNNKLWINDDGTLWEPTDLHSMTTKKAFPELVEGTSEFKKARYMGKMTNFSSNYGVGTAKLADQLDCTMEVAAKLRDGYKASFPGVIQYGREVSKMFNLKGYVENLYGRKYYIDDSSNYYKGGNYLVQGSCADSLKEIEVHICEFLKDKKSKFILAIHDELAFEIANGEEWIVPEIKQIMESVRDKIPYVPIVCEVESSKTNWAEKKGWHSAL